MPTFRLAGALACFLILPGLLAACASAQDEATAAKPRRICEREAPTGSNLPVLRCRDDESMAIDRDTVRAVADDVRRGSTGVKSSAGQ